MTKPLTAFRTIGSFPFRCFLTEVQSHMVDSPLKPLPPDMHREGIPSMLPHQLSGVVWFHSSIFRRDKGPGRTPMTAQSIAPMLCSLTTQPRTHNNPSDFPEGRWMPGCFVSDVPWGQTQQFYSSVGACAWASAWQVVIYGKHSARTTLFRAQS